MDLNYIRSRHQLSLVAAETAAGPEARAAHCGLAEGYAVRIRTFQREAGATANSAPLA